MIRVQFLKAWRNYNRGEVAAFDQHMVDQLVAGFWAVPVEAEEAEVEVADSLPVQGGDGADSIIGADGADTLTGADGADSVAGAHADPAKQDKPAASGLPKQGAGK